MVPPHFSLIIPAYNEEAFLPKLLESVREAIAVYSQAGGSVEVIVADNCSTDQTAAIAQSYGATVVREEKRIIAAVRNAGARLARGEILAFVDADTIIHPQTFNAIFARLKKGDVVAGATGVRFQSFNLGLTLTYAVMVPLVWLTGMDTGVVFCRKSDFDSFGGYNEKRLFAEDVEFLLRLKRLGKSRGEKLCRLRQVKAIFSTRKFDEHGQWHYLAMIGRILFGTLFNQKSVDKFAQRYWYGPQRPPPR